MGSALGAAKKTAAYLGLTLDEYQAKIVTSKWCTGCKEWHDRTEFDIDRSRGDGLKSACREASRRWQRIPPEKQKPRGPRGGKHSAETRARMSAARKGKPSPHRGRRLTLEQRALISKRTRETTPRGAACHSYKDGKLAERRDERNSPAYKRWRYDVFMRDAFTCQACGDDRGGNLVAHHIKSFAEHPDLRFDVANGVTWCSPCHRAHHKEHGYG